MKFVKRLLAGVIILAIVAAAVMLKSVAPNTSAGAAEDMTALSASVSDKLTEYAKSRDVIDALVVASSDAVLFSHGDAHLPINTHSARKSIMSVLIGMAVMEGKLNAQQTLAELGVDDAVMPLTDLEKRATVADLLMARSGIYIEAAGETPEMKAGRPQRGQFAPSERYYYNNWDFNTLGSVLAAATGEPLEARMGDLAVRLEFEDYRDGHLYYQTTDGSEHDQYTIFLSARDLARVGQMMLRNGRDPSGKPVITREWIDESTSQHSTITDADPLDGYGYLWWLDRDTGTYMASGWGGQMMLVDPVNDRVIVARNDTGRRLGEVLWLVILGHSGQGRPSNMMELREILTGE